MFSALALGCILQRPVTVKPPELATADGITVGLTTVQQFERKFGKGAVHVGGHSNSGRFWYDKTHLVTIDVDGFDFDAKNEEIIDTLSIEFDPKSKRLTLRAKARNPGILEKLKPGMSHIQVEKALHVKLPNDSITVSGLVRYSTPPQNKDNNHFTTWQVNFDIGDHGLQGFEINAD